MNISDLPSEQVEEVLNQTMCDIDREFLGFVEIYEALAKIIPKHFTIVDLGCAYNPQCFLFKDHKRVISVDLPGMIEKRFKSINCEIIEMPIHEFIPKFVPILNLEETFAICSYVPNWFGNNSELVRHNFKNVFTYYPHGSSLPLYLNKRG